MNAPAQSIRERLRTALRDRVIREFGPPLVSAVSEGIGGAVGIKPGTTMMDLGDHVILTINAGAGGPAAARVRAAGPDVADGAACGAGGRGRGVGVRAPVDKPTHLTMARRLRIAWCALWLVLLTAATVGVLAFGLSGLIWLALAAVCWLNEAVLW